VSAADAAHGQLGIGGVLALLRVDFPDVTISKIRFLEAEGLVEPGRTASGYRKFGPEDVERLRYVLTCQRDQYLPLKVIREQLEALDGGPLSSPAPAGDPVTVPRAAAVPGRRPAPPGRDRAPVAKARLSRRELLAESGLSEPVLEQLESFAIVAPLPYGGPVRHYDGAALDIARTVARMAAFGIEPRHLRQFKVAADREVGLVAQVVTPMLRQRDPQSRRRAEDAIGQLAALSTRLHRSLVSAGLAREMGD
jgi:DNA-binding transcriptional MerR regulator